MDHCLGYNFGNNILCVFDPFDLWELRMLIHFIMQLFALHFLQYLVGTALKLVTVWCLHSVIFRYETP